jgi:hypothetical protein
MHLPQSTPANVQHSRARNLRHYCPRCGMVAGQYDGAAIKCTYDKVPPHPLYQFSGFSNPGMPDDLCPGGPFDPIKDRAP